MEVQKMNQQQIQFAPNVQTTYADDVLIDHSIKVHVEEINGERKGKKSGKVTLLFMDQQLKSVTHRVIIDPFTAKRLGEMLTHNLPNFIKELESDSIPEQALQQFEKEKKEKVQQKSNTYIG